ncbi:MAG TPA: UDP-glucuronic acid decarboxylase family protein [Patescibacteria group bacterium]
MNILVTGGAGFIGSHLIDQLLKDENVVYCVDNLITGSLKNIEHHKNNKNFKFINHDIVEPVPIGFLPKRINQIYHLASPADPLRYFKLAIQTMLTNSIGTYHVVELSNKHKARILFTSTSEIYGDPLEHPQKETYFGNVNPVGPRAVYDEAKRFAETMIEQYHREFNLDTRIIRIFNTYGPRMHEKEGRMVPNFIKRALKGEPIEIYGDGKNTRSLCFVSDLVEGLIYSMEKNGIAGEVINLGNPDEYSVLDFAKIVIDATSSRSEIKFLDAWKDDPRQRKPDITKAKRLLNWSPSTNLDEGLKQTLSFFQSSS